MRSESWVCAKRNLRFSRMMLRRKGGYRSHTRRSGAELLELGLVLGLILLPIMFGTIEFGTYFYVEHNLQSAAREGARAACVYATTDPTGQYNAAQTAATNLLKQSSLYNWIGTSLS